MEYTQENRAIGQIQNEIVVISTCSFELSRDFLFALYHEPIFYIYIYILCCWEHSVYVWAKGGISVREGAHVNTMWPMMPMMMTAMVAVRGGRQALRPSPAERGPHHRPGIGEAEFFPRCIAAGCSPRP